VAHSTLRVETCIDRYAPSAKMNDLSICLLVFLFGACCYLLQRDGSTISFGRHREGDDHQPFGRAHSSVLLVAPELKCGLFLTDSLFPEDSASAELQKLSLRYIYSWLLGFLSIKRPGYPTSCLPLVLFRSTKSQLSYIILRFLGNHLLLSLTYSKHLSLR
jgi:hypothetical protein